MIVCVCVRERERVCANFFLGLVLTSFRNSLTLRLFAVLVGMLCDATNSYNNYVRMNPPHRI